MLIETTNEYELTTNEYEFQRLKERVFYAPGICRDCGIVEIGVVNSVLCSRTVCGLNDECTAIASPWEVLV